ncbi:MAG: undecaprenyldiphospho-muramoylpentapeptide beta-N-acetylglucosaminyltransferase [Acidobacteria bacterium]|nr:undecaprenyldiphospho-muramoylpentapeptide beta-N-acetylglucosaminyltransferase [Acidobacteriota bacterium]
MLVLIAGGGTGGHLYPGIALARELQRRDPATVVTFVGTATGIEARVIPREGFPLELIRVKGLKGTSLMARLRGLALLPLAFVDAWRVISRRRPAVVVGVGGFASGPIVALAALRRRPTLLLEQNAMPGLTNRLLAPFVRAAAVNFPEALRHFPRTGFVAGNPVRASVFEPAEARVGEAAMNGAAPPERGRVLVFGGSQGAHAINMAMIAAAPVLARSGVQLNITHQTGERDLPAVVDGYRQAGVAARVEAFLYDMDREMKAADVIVSRAGATTLSELAAVGRPAVLVPLPTATDDHQRRNAEAFAASGGAVVIHQRALTGEKLADELLALVRDPERRRQMGQRARVLARPDAAERIADKVAALAR